MIQSYTVLIICFFFLMELWLTFDRSRTDNGMDSMVDPTDHSEMTFYEACCVQILLRA